MSHENMISARSFIRELRKRDKVIAELRAENELLKFKPTRKRTPGLHITKTAGKDA